MDNMWHVLFHAIPTRELFLRRGLELQSVDFLPRYTVFWPVANARENYNREPLKPVLQWPGWETLMRSLIDARTDVRWPELAARTQQLVAPRRWHCYRRLIAGHVGWWPRLIGRNYSALFAARPSALGFRSVVMRNLGVLGRSPELRIIFELRERSRWAADGRAEKVGMGTAGTEDGGNGRWVNGRSAMRWERQAAVARPRRRPSSNRTPL